MKRIDSLPTGSNELIFIQTKKVSLTIKGRATHPQFENVETNVGNSIIKIYCDDDFSVKIKENDMPGIKSNNITEYSWLYSVTPIFFEQQIYDLFIEPEDKFELTFWHDNINVRNKITQVGKHGCLSGSFNFGNEIGLSDLVIKVDGEEYLRLVIEVFPTKISYQDDYKAIIKDVTEEVYNIVFDFLKKTYLGYQQSDRTNSSPVEFFAVIKKIFSNFIRAIDMILSQPHHVLDKTYDILPSHKIKRIDKQGIRWIEKHPDQARITCRNIDVSKTLAVKKQITYDTKENRFTKHILASTIKRLENFKNNYLKLQREEDLEVTKDIDRMIKSINRRSNTSFLENVGIYKETTGMSLVFSMAPGYRDLYKYYLMLLRGLDITGDVFNISIKDLAILYEYWCFIKLNSIMKERYELVSQDIAKVHGNGLFVSLVKGSASKVVYRNPKNNEKIVLSYNPTEKDTPTVSQKPDNVLSLIKTGSNMEYEYIFDAKYRINPALPGTYYHNHIYSTPGPQEDDINTMHRYRDAIVYSKGANPYERTMFGAYVLFPYNNRSEYVNHKFYKSIEKVNIGGLPFLPSETFLVSRFLDELIGDSSQSAFERATLPIGIEEKLAKTDWMQRDVLIGVLKNKEQLETNLRYKFYHIPASKIEESAFPIHYIAIYQSKRIFKNESGVQWYGEVTKCIPIKRKYIKEIYKNSDELYYKFEIKEWKKLTKKITIKEDWPHKELMYTNLFLLEHSSQVPELWLKSEEEYRLYSELKRSLENTEINDEEKNIGFVFNNANIVFENGEIQVYKDKKLCDKYDIKSFTRTPNAVFRKIQEILVDKNTLISL